MKILVTGISGTGKTTLAKSLAERGYKTIDIDHIPNLCSWINRETGEKSLLSNIEDPDNEFIDSHDYVCDVVQLEEMMDRSEENVFVFGSVGDNSSLVHLFDKIILLQCGPETIVHRLESRQTNDFGKKKEVQNRMLEWRDVFDNLMVGAGAIVINTDQSIGKVVEDLEKIVVNFRNYMNV